MANHSIASIAPTLLPIREEHDTGTYKKGVNNIKKRISILNDMYKDKVDVTIDNYQDEIDVGTIVTVTLKKD